MADKALASSQVSSGRDSEERKGAGIGAKEGAALGVGVLDRPAEPTFPRAFDKSVEQRPYENRKVTEENPYVPSVVQKSTEVTSTNRLASRPTFGAPKPPSMGRPRDHAVAANSSISQPQLSRNETKSTRPRIADPFAQVGTKINDYSSQEAMPTN